MNKKHKQGMVNYGIRDSLLDQLKTGLIYVMEHQSKPDLKILIRLSKKDDLEDILALQARVYENIQDKNTFVRTTEEELLESIDFDVCIGAYHYGVLVGFTLMVVNPYSTRNLGLYLGYSQEQCAKCVTYDTTFVEPSYKGYGLQRIFIRLKDTMAKSFGAREALATVSPDNGYSLENLKASGFVIAEQKKMYGSFDRLILRKPLYCYLRQSERTQ